MTRIEKQQLRKASGAGRPALALLVGLLFAVLTSAVGATPAAAGKRVGASHSESILVVGSTGSIAAGHVGVHTLPKPQVASATGVAAKAGPLKGPIADQVARNLPEQMALESARSGAGRVIIENLGDAPRLVAHYGPGQWVKMENVVRGIDGNVTVHWFRNLTSGQNVEFKFTSRYGG